MKWMNLVGQSKTLMPNNQIMLSPEEFFDEVYRRYLLAKKSTKEEHIVKLKIGNKIISLHFASIKLSSVILPVVKHLECDFSLKSEFNIYLWDSISTGIPMIQRPWEDEAFMPKGAIKGFSNDTIKTVFQADRNALSLLDLKNNIAVYWVQDAEAVPYFETGAPLLGILPQWLLMNGYIFIHGAAVGIENYGVLIVGSGGSGKSTTVLRCLKKESFKYVADDYCLVEMNNNLKVHSIYNSAKVDSELIDEFSFLKNTLYNSERLKKEKALFILFPSFRNRLAKFLYVKAILIPCISGEKVTKIISASTSDALKALAPSTVLQIPGFGKDSFLKISNLVKKVPAYFLKLGTNSDEISEVIYKFLKELT